MTRAPPGVLRASRNRINHKNAIPQHHSARPAVTLVHQGCTGRSRSSVSEGAL